MKQSIAIRIEANLLKEVRQCASAENRTLTNFIETVLKIRVAAELRSMAGPLAGEPKGEERCQDRRG
jgi:hypothetical protein